MTAEVIYDNCDGKEFELSNIPLYLSFVPEDIKFPYAAKEVCNEIPSIACVKNFVNRSIGHTNVKLTWDEPNYDRFNFINNKDITEEQLN